MFLENFLADIFRQSCKEIGRNFIADICCLSRRCVTCGIGSRVDLVGGRPRLFTVRDFVGVTADLLRREEG